MLRSKLSVLASAALLASAASAQQFLGALSTQGYGQNSGHPFGLAFAPNGHLYVSLAGSASLANPQFFNNNVVLRIDPASDAVVGPPIVAGLFPEEIAFAAPGGGPAVGLVTNSTDGTVTVFDLASGSTLATVALPGGFLAAFPFGIATNANETTAYVSVVDGSNTLRAIDLDPASPTAYQHVPSLDVALGSGAGARFARAGSGFVVPTTSYFPGFAGSTAHAERLAPAGAAAAVVLASDGNFSTYPSTQDVAIAADGIAYVAGYDLARRIYGLDVATGALVRSFPSGTTIGAHTGLALSPDGKVLAVCDVAANEISFVDVARGLPFSLVNTAALGFGQFQPNDAAFSPDGSKVYVTCQGSESVVVLAAPPSPAAFAPPLGFHVAPTAPALGAAVSLSTSGGGPNDLVAIFAGDLDLAIDGGAAGVLHVGPGATLLGSTTGGDLVVSATAPSSPTLYGKNFLCQAIAFDLVTGVLRLSEEIPVVLQ